MYLCFSLLSFLMPILLSIFMRCSFLSAVCFVFSFVACFISSSAWNIFSFILVFYFTVFFKQYFGDLLRWDFQYFNSGYDFITRTNLSIDIVCTELMSHWKQNEYKIYTTKQTPCNDSYCAMEFSNDNGNGNNNRRGIDGGNDINNGITERQHHRLWFMNNKPDVYFGDVCRYLKAINIR